LKILRYRHIVIVLCRFSESRWDSGTVCWCEYSHSVWVSRVWCEGGVQVYMQKKET